MNLLNPIAAHLLPLVRAQNSRLYGTPNDVPSGSYGDARDRAGREAGAFEAMKTVDAAAVATLVAPATADEIVRMAFKAQRVDVVVVALPHHGHARPQPVALTGGRLDHAPTKTWAQGPLAPVPRSGRKRGPGPCGRCSGAW